MTNQEIRQTIREAHVRRFAALEEIAAIARRLIPTLKDHNLTETARELDRAIFNLDAITGDLHKIVEADPEAFIKALLEGVKGSGQ